MTGGALLFSLFSVEKVQRQAHQHDDRIPPSLPSALVGSWAVLLDHPQCFAVVFRSFVICSVDFLLCTSKRSEFSKNYCPENVKFLSDV